VGDRVGQVYTATVSFLILLSGVPLFAQADGPPGVETSDGNAAAAVQANSRAEEIEKNRELKAQRLQPDEPTKWEQRIIRYRKNKLVEDIFSSPDGVGVTIGGLPVAQGFAVGASYRRRYLWDGRLQMRATARASARKAYLLDFNATLPRLGSERTFLNLYAYHFDYPNLQYYGPGPNSSRHGRSVFRLENTGIDIRPGVKLAPGLTAGLLGSFVAVNVGRGENDHLGHTENIYRPALAPGIDRQSSFLEGGAFLQFDWRNYPGEPTRGGLYRAQYQVISDRDLRLGSFNRLDLEADQYIPFFQDKRVFALRGKASLTDTHHNQVVPFYLQPTLGGSESLRGYRPYRFYDDNSLVLTAEYRYEIFSGLDMALFADSGQVFHRLKDFDAGRLQSDIGFGFRFNVRNNVFLRIDTAFSHEGFQVWFKFNNVF